MSEYTHIVGIDTGTEQTAMCLCRFDDLYPLSHVKLANEKAEETLETWLCSHKHSIVAIELLENHGMPIGQTTIKTIIEIGRIQHLCELYFIPWMLVKRSEEKLTICFSVKAKDSNIRQSLMDIYGTKGTKKNQGWFYGFKADEWQAYAIAHTAREKINRSKDE